MYDESELLEEALAVSEFGEESGVGCMRKKADRHVYVFWALVFAAAFLILGFVGYSDGDDAYFYEYTHKMGFWSIWAGDMRRGSGGLRGRRWCISLFIWDCRFGDL